MSRFIKSMIVLLAIVAMATPVMAEDMLSLGGQMRVRGWHIDDGGERTTSFMDQRLRIGGKFSVAEGVSITFRTDVTERTWGSGGSEYGSGRMPQDGQQWDRAHIDLDFGGFALRAGQQYVQFGAGATMNAQEAGVKFTVKGPVPVTLFWMLDDTNGSSTNTSDDYFYGANVALKGEGFGANVFTGGQKNDAEGVYLVGADATFSMDAFKLVTELDFFTGDASDTVDAMGTQFMLDASMAASETMTFGGQVLYALGAATDGSEAQYVVLGNDFGGWDPLFDVGTGLDNEKIGTGRPYDVFGGGSGVMALRGYTSIKASDALKVGASVAYAEPEEDANTAADSLIGVAAGLSYKVMANTKFDVQVEYVDFDEAGADSILQAGCALFVNF